MEEQKIEHNSETPLKVVGKSSASIPVSNRSPLTLIAGVELSTSNKLVIHHCIIDVNDGLDEYDLNDNLNYNSDGNLLTQATLMDSQHGEHDGDWTR